MRAALCWWLPVSQREIWWSFKPNPGESSETHITWCAVFGAQSETFFDAVNPLFFMVLWSFPATREEKKKSKRSFEYLFSPPPPLLNHFHNKAFLTIPVGSIRTEPLKVWVGGLEYNLRLLCNFCAVLSFPTGAQGEKKKGGGGSFLLVAGQIHCVSIFQPLPLPLSNSGLMIVILKQSDLSNQKQRWWMPRCSVCLFVLGWRGGGGGGGGGVGVVGGIEFYAYLLRCIFLTAAALLYPRRQHWLNGIVLLSG